MKSYLEDFFGQQFGEVLCLDVIEIGPTSDGDKGIQGLQRTAY
jgi:hypothetical protein